jgi:hypothetical protein
MPLNQYEQKKAILHVRARAFEDAAHALRFYAQTGYDLADVEKAANDFEVTARGLREDADSPYSSLMGKTVDEVLYTHDDEVTRGPHCGGAFSVNQRRDHHGICYAFQPRKIDLEIRLRGRNDPTAASASTSVAVVRRLRQPQLPDRVRMGWTRSLFAPSTRRVGGIPAHRTVRDRVRDQALRRKHRRVLEHDPAPAGSVNQKEVIL